VHKAILDLVYLVRITVVLKFKTTSK